MRIDFPSSVFPAPTSFRLEVPEGWTPKPDARGLVVVVGPVTPSGYVTNLLGCVHRVPLPVDLAGLPSNSGESRPLSVNGRRAHSVRQVIRFEDWEEPIVSQQVLVAVPFDDLGLADIVDVQITTTETFFGEIQDQIAAILDSLAIPAHAGCSD
jgi:hypothetical protein